MTGLMSLSLMLSLLTPPAGGAQFACTGPFLAAPDAAGLSAVLFAAPPNRGMGGIGRGRPMGRFGTDRGMAKTGTGRAMAKVGTGRPMAKMGTGRPMAKMSHPLPLGESDGKAGDGTVTMNPPPVITAGGEEEDEGGATLNSNGGKESPGGRTARPSVKKIAFSPGVMEFIEEGDRNMREKNYHTAFRNYFVAQQVEGFRGPSNLRIAGAQVAMGRYFEATESIRLYLDKGGEIPEEGFSLPEDKNLEENLEVLLRQNPLNSDLCFSAAFYSYSRGDMDKTAKRLEALRKLDHRHACLEPLEKAVTSKTREKDDPSGKEE